MLLFEKPSARTRASTEMAVVGLGGHPIYVRPEEVGLGVRESVADVARTFAGFCSVIAARVFDHATLEEMAAVVDVPVVNLLSDRAHPTPGGRRLPHPARAVRARSRAGGSPTSATATTSPRRSRSPPRCRASSSPSHRRPGYELDDLTVERARNLGGTIELGRRPVRGGRRRRRGLHRRVDVDGSGGRARRPARRVRRAHRSTTR